MFPLFQKKLIDFNVDRKQVAKRSIDSTLDITVNH